jgi:hypothetical protein
MDKGTSVAFGVQGIPALFIIDQDGKIGYKHEGFDPNVDFEELMTNAIALNPLKIKQPAGGIEPSTY